MGQTGEVALREVYKLKRELSIMKSINLLNIKLSTYPNTQIGGYKGIAHVLVKDDKNIRNILFTSFYEFMKLEMDDNDMSAELELNNAIDDFFDYVVKYWMNNWSLNEFIDDYLYIDNVSLIGDKFVLN